MAIQRLRDSVIALFIHLIPKYCHHHPVIKDDRGGLSRRARNL